MGVRSKEMRASLSRLCTQTQENPLPIHAVDPDTTSAGDGWWWPERRRTARKEPPFCSMLRAGPASCPSPSPSFLLRFPPACLRALISAGSPWLSLRPRLDPGERAGWREIPRADHGEESGGGGGKGLHDDKARLGAAAVSSLLLLLSPVGLAALALLAWPLSAGDDNCARVLLLSRFSQI